MPATLDMVQLQAELQALREQVVLLQQQVRRPQVALESSRPAPFLGQSLVLTGTVTDGTGQPQGGTAVVVATTWGRLRSRDRLVAQQGSSLAVTTDAEGRFSLDLLPPTSEDLLAAQQGALEPLLARLDATATTPHQTAADLREMAQLYQWDVNHAYRQALDIYFRDFGEGLLESVNRHDYLQAWDYLEATVTAYVQPPGSTTVAGLGTLMVPFRNWLGPWLEVFLSLSQTQNPLPAVLDALQKTSPLGNLQEGVYRRVSDYVGSQSGIVGAYIGRKVVEKTVQSFLLEGLDSVEDAGIKADLAPTLNMASGLLAVGGVSGLQSVVQTRRDLKQEVGSQVEASGIAVGALSDRVASMATQVTGLQTAFGTVDSRVGTLTTQLTGLQTSLGSVDSRVGTLTTQLGDVQSSLGTVSGRVTTLQTRFNQFDSRVGSLVTDLGTVQEQVAGFQGRFAQVDDQVGRLSTQFGGLQRSVEQLDASTTTRFTQIGGRIGTLEGRLTLVDNRFGTVVGRVDTLQTTVIDFDRTVANVRDSVGQVSDRIDTQAATIATLQAQDREFDGQITTLQTRSQATDGRVTALGQEVVGLRQDTVSLNNSLALTNNSLDGLQRNVSTLNTQVGRLDTRVTTVSGQVGRLSTSVTSLDTQFGDLNSQVVNLDGRFSNLNGRMVNLDGRFNTLDGQVGGLQRNLVTLNRAASSRIVGLEDSISRVGNNVLSLRTDLNQ
ncbi:hypothetical protein IQ254_20490 [Nodosilinea sp. LEGE 07088]|uniref:hypothetical protein n=1 Tax=Nodosilinea sp. LEGE 07088 TaxID=2777968 RepID=UPI00187ED40A|nr:hypothetical protein [Nodosilinea sp. LEGE 07088]MBE9139546.1 hypothetical protein [Nodosilinea sp. LEGE 07088]